jgi:hypothetical protein
MSWHFSQALEAAFSEANCLDGERSVLLRSKNTPEMCCLPDKMTEASNPSLCGTMCEPLTESRGEELLTWFREVSRARTSALQEKEPDSTESVQDCGWSLQGSFVKYDRASRSWKTRQCSLLGGSDEFLETWPNWGLMLNGECMERETLELTTKRTGSGLWLTPSVQDCKTDGPKAIQAWVDAAKEGKRPKTSAQRLRNQVVFVTGKYGHLNPEWIEWLMGWPLGWTDLKHLEMDKFHEWQQAHGGYCLDT